MSDQAHEETVRTQAKPVWGTSTALDNCKVKTYNKRFDAPQSDTDQATPEGSKDPDGAEQTGEDCSNFAVHVPEQLGQDLGPILEKGMSLRVSNPGRACYCC